MVLLRDMALMQSCCCWRSLRKGSYASAAYTVVYFTLIVIIMTNFLHEESLYWSGVVDRPQSRSLLEPEAISATTMGFHVAVLICALLGVVSSLMLVYGVYTDKRVLLVPWIMTISMTTLVDLTHSIYLFALDTISFHPLTGMLFTIDFFLISLNIYCLVCVVSQYQEYRAGRGTASHDSLRTCKVPASKYLPQQGTGTTCVSSRRAAGVGGTCNEETSPQGESATDNKLPSPPIQARPGKKHVQFGENKEFLIHVQYRISKGNTTDCGSAVTILGIDREPLIQKCVEK